MSTNEWDQLKKVIVGIADYAKIPEMDRSLRLINYADKKDISKVKIGKYPNTVIDEANEDLEIFVNFLKDNNIEVVRPKSEDSGYYNYCPRDCIFVHGNKSLSTPMPLKSRRSNWLSLKHHFNHVDNISCTYEDELYDDNCIGNKNILALTDHSPAFDAANVIRANDDVLYLVSNSGNKSGAEWLQRYLGKNITVHTLENVYSYVHIDTTVAFLREGLLLANPSRIKDKSVLPNPFCNWDIIWCPEPVDIGYYPDYNNASPWSNMNLFSINPNLVVIEEHQHPTRKVLEKYGIECAMLPMRHQRTLSGGFHCVTLDLIRG